MSGGRSLASELSRLVVEALVKVGLKQEDILAGPIDHTDLPWQIPPLLVEATLFDVPLSEYLGAVHTLRVENLYNLWSEALLNLKNHPSKVMGFDGYRGAGMAIPLMKSRERSLHLSAPDGYPGPVSVHAGITLSLECAHLLRSNAKIAAFHSDDDNYYAVLPDGEEVGIKDGIPALWGDQWDISMKGMIQELLRTPRGPIWEGCDYNIISKVRSVVHKYEKHVRDFEAVDWAMQALRVLQGEQEMLAAIRTVKMVSHVRKQRKRVLNEAVEVVERLAISDRQRIETLKSLLVPEILTSGQFSRQIYTFYAPVPAMLADKVLVRVKSAIHSLAEEEERLYAVENEFRKS